MGRSKRIIQIISKKLLWLIANPDWGYYVMRAVLIIIGLATIVLCDFGVEDDFFVGLLMIGIGIFIILVRRIVKIKIK